VISKLHSPGREERVQNYLISSGRANSGQYGTGWGKEGDSRFQLDFGLLHAGV
jgi:hypothetical protein